MIMLGGNYELSKGENTFIHLGGRLAFLEAGEFLASLRWMPQMKIDRGATRLHHSLRPYVCF